MLSKGPFLALLLWYSEKVGARLERDERVLMSKQSREEGAVSAPL
jgi:hypothetical protein